MTDLTPLFDSLLAVHSAPPTTKRAFNVDSLDNFLKEAYTINHAIRSLHTDLLRIRQSYLSTAQPRRTLIRSVSGQHDGQRPLTDREREEIDANSKQLLRDLNAKIRQLADAEQIRQETEAALIKKKFVRGLSALGSWAAGGGGALDGKSKSSEHRAAEEAANSVNTHRESVLWMLRQRLQECVKTQQGMMEVRLKREMEKSRSVLAKVSMHESAGMPGMSREPGSPTAAKRQASHGLPPEDRPAYHPAEELSAEQIQMFEQENHDMLQHYESVLGQVR
jgi:syntaxin 18